MDPKRTAPMIVLKGLSLFLITAYHWNVPEWGWVLENHHKPCTTLSIKVDDHGYQKIKYPILIHN